MNATAFLSIALIHLLAAISPGPSFVVAVRTGAAEGARVASALAFGLGLGALVWALAAILGLAALFEVAPTLLTVLKVVGGAFLVWIGVQTWRHARAPLAQPGPGAAPRGIRAGVHFGLVTRLANPKPAVFFGAVFLGLAPPDAGPGALALLLGVIFLDETLWYMFVGRVFALPRPRAAYGRAKRWVDRGFGGLIAAFGLQIAAT